MRRDRNRTFPCRVRFLGSLRGLLLPGALGGLLVSGCGAGSAPAPSNPSASVTPSGTVAPPVSTAGDPSASPAGAPVSSAGGPATAIAPQTLAVAPAAAPPKPAVPPTAEQIASWGLTEVAPLQLLACYDGFSDSFVESLAIAPDGKQFVLGGARVTLWDPAKPEPTADLLEKTQGQEVDRPILALAISPDGQWLAAGDMKGTLRIWKRTEEGEPAVIKAHEGRLVELAFSPDSKTLATTSYGGEVRLWNVADGKKLKSLKVDKQQIGSLVFLSDTLLAAAGSEAAVWNVEKGEKVATLTTGRLIGPALGLSSDRRWLAFADSDSKTKLWDVEKQAAAPAMLHAGANRIEFSHDGKWIATYAEDRTIRIWNGATKALQQVIDADGGRTVAFRWLPGNDVLVVATENGRVRLWGRPDAAPSFGVTPLPEAKLRTGQSAAKRSESSAQFEQVVDVRSLPRLPDAVPTGDHGGSSTYNTIAPPEEIEQFYRYVLGKGGWKESSESDPARPGLNFDKEGCTLNLSVSAAYPAPGTTPRPGEQQVSLRFAGNYDGRWLPKILPSESPNSFSSFSANMYRTKASITDVEVALLRQFQKAGWTPYSRLATSHSEEPTSRSFSMLQGGSVLTVSIGTPSDVPGELFVQVGAKVSNKSLPIPPDAGWIEFDSSTDLRMVATTKMTLPETAAFYDAEMPQEGWLVREADRKIDEEKGRGWLPYIRGQRDVLVRLVALEEGGTRILVGDAERTSWQLKEPAKAPKDQAGIEAADFQLPKGASGVKFDVDGKQIEFELADVLPTKVGERFAKQMEELGWKRDGAGIQGDDYTFLTYEKGKAEIQLRARGEGKKSTAVVSGDGLLWTKPLPTAPVRVSYETWMIRNRKRASLEHLDEFAAEMQKIPAK